MDSSIEEHYSLPKIAKIIKKNFLFNSIILRLCEEVHVQKSPVHTISTAEAEQVSRLCQEEPIPILSSEDIG